MAGLLGLGGHPVLRWMAGHVAIKTDDAGNIKPTKQRSADRIDGVVAGIMGLGLAIGQEPGMDLDAFLEAPSGPDRVGFAAALRRQVLARMAGWESKAAPLRFARQTVSVALAADEVANKLFANGVRPSGLLQMDQVLKPDQRKDLRENVVAPLAGSSNAGGVFVLEGGMKVSAVSLSPADSQLLESRRWHVEEICRWFGIPPILIGHASEGQTVWGTGVEQIALSWLALGLRAQLRRIEAAINLRLIEPAERATL
ncbi:phage portal protein, HK97 family [Methylobacterium sp. UNC378MF]|uniref:phage portal protein n=1 Tax=Methylobacterium sp. UNC378MF TaxID=1502748 RepID=UPI00088292FE|nr:phage portal protein [Methylobacterium sp. UNC378MF]SDA30041.1 phage portal protein, HK97 family [Methylobacterium sp. UNC378MF]